MIADSLNLENPKIVGSRWSHPSDNPIGVPRKLWADHFTVLFCVPNPKRLKSKLKLVLEGLMPCRTPNVIAQHSQVDKILVAARTPIQRVSRTLKVDLKKSRILSVVW